MSRWQQLAVPLEGTLELPLVGWIIISDVYDMVQAKSRQHY